MATTEHRAGTLSRWRRPIGALAAAAAAIALMALPAAAGTSYSVTDTINVSGKPWGVAADPTGTGTVYVTSFSDPFTNGIVSVIDAAHNTVTTTVPVGHVPDAVAVDDSTGTVYVANSFDDTVSVIDRATGSNGPTYTPAATVKVGSGPDAVAVDATSHTVYVANSNDRSVSVIDATTNLVTATVNVGNGPAGVAVDPTSPSHTVYVTNQYDGTVSVITPTTDNGVTSYTVAAPMHVGIGPIGVAVDPGSHAVYVANDVGSNVSVIDGSSATPSVTATVSVGTNPVGVAVDASTHTVYVTNNNDSANSVSVIDGSAPTPTVVATVSVGDTPQGVAVYATTGHSHAAYVALGTTNRVSVITPPVSDTDLAVTAPENVTVDATGPSGATVSYPPPVVTDGDDTTAPAAVCAPGSGSVFPVGTTMVTCTATDTDDTPSSVSTSFTVSVKGAAAQLADLNQAVQGVGPGTSLSHKVTTARAYLASGNVPDTCSTLTAFTHQVRAQSGKHIPTATARTLLADAQRIQAVLAC